MSDCFINQDHHKLLPTHMCAPPTTPQGCQGFSRTWQFSTKSSHLFRLLGPSRWCGGAAPSKIKPAPPPKRKHLPKSPSKRKHRSCAVRSLVLAFQCLSFVFLPSSASPRRFGLLSSPDRSGPLTSVVRCAVLTDSNGGTSPQTPLDPSCWTCRVSLPT